MSGSRSAPARCRPPIGRFSSRARARARAGDRPRSPRLFRGPDGEMVEAPATLERLRPARARMPTGRAATSRAASTPSARITAPAPTRRLEQDEADLAAGTDASPARPSSSGAILSRPRRRESPPAVWRRSFAPDIREQRRRDSGHFVAEEDPNGISVLDFSLRAEERSSTCDGGRRRTRLTASRLDCRRCSTPCRR